MEIGLENGIRVFVQDSRMCENALDKARKANGLVCVCINRQPGPIPHYLLGADESVLDLDQATDRLKLSWIQETRSCAAHRHAAWGCNSDELLGDELQALVRSTPSVTSIKAIQALVGARSEASVLRHLLYECRAIGTDNERKVRWPFVLDGVYFEDVGSIESFCVTLLLSRLGLPLSWGPFADDKESAGRLLWALELATEWRLRAE